MADPAPETLAPLARWRGKVALVTGASSGIGESIARRLARAGMRVVALARREERLAALAESVADSPGELLPIACDVRDEAAILAAFAQVRERWGGVDVLVNNAGLGHKSPLTSGETAHWRDMLEVNVLALHPGQATLEQSQQGSRGRRRTG